MSKKHFVQLADAVRNLSTHDDGETVNLSAVVQSLADFCASQNPAFNRSRWLAYIAGECGPNGGKR
jgi:hypothetical protein